MSLAGPPKVLLADNYNSHNGGDAAILEGMLAGLRPSLPGAEFVVSSSYPEVARAVHGLAAVAWTPRRLASRRALASWLARSAAWVRTGHGALGAAEAELMNAYRSADLVLGVGGAYLRSGYRLTALRLWQMRLAQALSRPVMLYGVSVGPFTPGPLARWAAFVLDRLDVITLRDEPSAAELRRLGVRRPLIVVAADAALALPSVAARAPDASHPAVGVSVLHWHKFRRGSFAEYARAVAGALDELLESWAGSVTFLSTTVAPPGQEMDVSGTSRDDAAAARDVVRAMRHGGCTRLVAEPMPLDELRARVAGFDLWIGTRMHSCLFATTGGAPAVGIGYEPKVAGYFRQLGLEDYVVDVEDVASAPLAALATRAYARRTEIRGRVAQRLPALRARSLASADAAVALLEGRHGGAAR